MRTHKRWRLSLTCCAMIWGILMLSTDVSSAEERYSIGKAVSSDTSKTPLILLSDGKAQIEAAIAPSKGGELSGLKVRHGGRWVETLYLARDYSPRESWTGKAPFLFPATGRNFPPDLEARRKAGETFNDGAYLLEGKRYSMPIHGFVRDLPWNVTKTQSLAGGAVAKLTLSDTPATRKWYPFGFAIDVDYTLADGALSIAYRIRADKENRSPMPFSVGNHITFVCPLIPGSDPEEMELVTPSKTELLKTSYGLPTGKSRPRSHAEGITLGRFERLKAVSLTRYAGKPSILLRDPQGLAILMSHTASQTPQQPVILYNIWGDAKGGFFSTEPWVGLQNSLVLGKGLVHLKPGRDFTWTIRIEFEHKSGA